MLDTLKNSVSGAIVENVISYGIPLLIGSLLPAIKRGYEIYKLKRIMKLKRTRMFKKPVCSINWAKRSGVLINDENVRATQIPRNDFVTDAEVFAAFGAYRTIFETDGEPVLSDNKDNNGNMFCVGGPLSNTETQELFIKYFPNISFGVSQAAGYINEKNQKGIGNVAHIDEDRNSGTIRIKTSEETKVFSFDRRHEGYIMLIRFAGVDVGDKSCGTVHVCFGNNAETTTKAAKCYTEHTNELYKRLRKRKDHYFVIIKCSKHGRIDFRSFLDITDYAFSKNTLQLLESQKDNSEE